MSMCNGITAVLPRKSPRISNCGDYYTSKCTVGLTLYTVFGGNHFFSKACFCLTKVLLLVADTTSNHWNNTFKAFEHFFFILK